MIAGTAACVFPPASLSHSQADADGTCAVSGGLTYVFFPPCARRQLSSHPLPAVMQQLNAQIWHINKIVNPIESPDHLKRPTSPWSRRSSSSSATASTASRTAS